MAHKAFTITEASDHERGVVVDRDKGIIRDVKILGLVSENNRRYLPEAVKSAKHLYEGIKVNINHPDSSNDQRNAEDRFGKLINVYFVEGEGLYGDLMFLKSHPMAERVCEAAERMTDVFGLSHNAQGDGVDDKDGCFVINEIVSVRHVDLVSDPATTKSLSEAIKVTKEAGEGGIVRPIFTSLDGNVKQALSAIKSARKTAASIKGKLKGSAGAKLYDLLNKIVGDAEGSINTAIMQLHSAQLDPSWIESKESGNMEKKSIKEAGNDSDKLNQIKEVVSSLDEADDILSRIAQTGSKIGPQAKRKVDNAISKIRDVERLVASLANQNLAEAIKTRESDMPYDKEMPEEEKDTKTDEEPIKEEMDSSDVDDAFMIAANLSNHSLKLISLLKGMKSEDASLFSRYIGDGDVKATRAYTDLKALADKLKKLASQLESDSSMEEGEPDIFDEEPSMSDEDPSEEVEPEMEEEELDKKAPMESKRIIKLCRANGIKPTKGLLEDFNGLSLASIKRHIGRLKLAKLSRAPRSSAPASSEISESKIPTDVFSWLRS